MNIHVRDTFISQTAFDAIPEARQQLITKLVNDFKNLGYIDARTEIGPDQWARMSEKRRQQISNTASRVFAIESLIKQLLRTDEQIASDELKEHQKQLESKKQSLKHQIKTLEDFCKRKLESKRSNSTKVAYQLLKDELSGLN